MTQCGGLKKTTVIYGLITICYFYVPFYNYKDPSQNSGLPDKLLFTCTQKEYIRACIMYFRKGLVGNWDGMISQYFLLRVRSNKGVKL